MYPDLASTEGSIRHRPSVCSGSFEGSDNLAWRAASLADLAACLGDGDFKGIELLVGGIVADGGGPGGGISLASGADTEAEVETLRL